ncbi:MAG: hypothetical protein ACKVQS_00210 [Fimbriimonadaceae bacterium]
MAKKLSARGMTVSACPLGTGVIITQTCEDGTPFTVHMTASEAKELSMTLDDAIQKVIKVSVNEKTVRSLFVLGFRLDQIATELNIPIEFVRKELVARGLLVT